MIHSFVVKHVCRLYSIYRTGHSQRANPSRVQFIYLDIGQMSFALSGKAVMRNRAETKFHCFANYLYGPKSTDIPNIYVGAFGDIFKRVAKEYEYPTKYTSRIF